MRTDWRARALNPTSIRVQHPDEQNTFFTQSSSEDREDGQRTKPQPKDWSGNRERPQPHTFLRSRTARQASPPDVVYLKSSDAFQKIVRDKIMRHEDHPQERVPQCTEVQIVDPLVQNRTVRSWTCPFAEEMIQLIPQDRTSERIVGRISQVSSRAVPALISSSVRGSKPPSWALTSWLIRAERSANVLFRHRRALSFLRGERSSNGSSELSAHQILVPDSPLTQISSRRSSHRPAVSETRWPRKKPKNKQKRRTT